MKSTISLRVEIYPVSEIQDAVREAKVLVRELDIRSVKFKFNDVDISVEQDSDVDDLVNRYYRIINEEYEYREI